MDQLVSNIWLICLTLLGIGCAIILLVCVVALPIYIIQFFKEEAEVDRRKKEIEEVKHRAKLEKIKRTGGKEEDAFGHFLW